MERGWIAVLAALSLALPVACTSAGYARAAEDEAIFGEADANGRLANEGFARCHKYVEGWLKAADPVTGLIPRNLGGDRDLWNAKDAAADNYPFMVLTCALTDRPMFDGRMLEMLRTETKLTSRLGAMPDDWSFRKQGFVKDEPSLPDIIFGSSEYVKDGLMPLTEWLGQSPWSKRLIAIEDSLWERAPLETPYGKIPSESAEINGEQLQVLSRLYWMTGNPNYLDYAVRLGDYYLLDKHPTRRSTSLRLRDHGCEFVSGLCELYATVHFAMPEKKKVYEGPVHEMLDRILEVGRNEHGMFYDSINPTSGDHSKGLADTWGYTYNGFYTVWLVDKTEAYREAVRKVLGNLRDHYRNYPWERASADGYADSIESAVNLYNREPVPSAAEWIDSEIQVMWQKQKPDGVIEGWHGDGNFARTTIMYCLWKTQGLTVRPWREDVVFGAVRDGDGLSVSLSARQDWRGKVLFDSPRHKTQMKMPLDWPRINQFPEWFTVQADARYAVRDMTTGAEKTLSGREMQDGIPVELKPGAPVRWRIEPPKP
jgi:hypothetical protein